MLFHSVHFRHKNDISADDGELHLQHGTAFSFCLVLDITNETKHPLKHSEALPLALFFLLFSTSLIQHNYGLSFTFEIKTLTLLFQPTLW